MLEEDFLYTMGSEYNYRVKGHLFHEDTYLYFLFYKKDYYKDYQKSSIGGIYDRTSAKIEELLAKKDLKDATTARMHVFFESYLGFGTTPEAKAKRESLNDREIANNRDIAKMLMHTRIYQEQMINLFLAADKCVPSDIKNREQAVFKLVRDNLFALSVQKKDGEYSDPTPVLPRKKICLMLSSDDNSNVVLPISYEESTALNYDNMMGLQRVKYTQGAARVFETKLEKVLTKYSKEHKNADLLQVNEDLLDISDMACDPRRYNRLEEVEKGKLIAEQEGYTLTK